MPAAKIHLCLLAAFTLLLTGRATAQEANTKKQDALNAAIKAISDQDNGITINREKAYIDLDASVCLRNAEMLEMFACTRDTREHESLLVVDAVPSLVHASLLLLGQKPGKPLFYDREANPPRLVPATGPQIRFSVVVAGEDGEKETPASDWVKNSKTGKAMKDNTWLFAGSVINTYDGERVYLADVNGSVVSLVNFGDDMLTLGNKLTQDNDSHNMIWAPRTEAIPAVGTKVTLRLRVSEPEAKPAGEAESKDTDKAKAKDEPADGGENSQEAAD